MTSVTMASSISCGRRFFNAGFLAAGPIRRLATVIAAGFDRLTPRPVAVLARLLALDSKIRSMILNVRTLVTSWTRHFFHVTPAALN
jgi:hypothetical protein